ncbi:cytochrome p450 [Stemphylium lycopersici]|nr:cytochrome p450 [Stemphylium lycopersici]RAQ98729.1 cytochrome p450 [Stemphylium lycopersici]
MFCRGLLSLMAIIIVYFIAQKRRRARLPPGPRGLPLIGNLHQAPKEAVWLTFHKWVKEYGNLVSVNFGGTTVIIVGDYETAKDLLDKRGNIYTSRPRLVMAQELICNNNHIMFKPFAEDFLLHQWLQAPDMESKQLLLNLLDDSVDYAHQIEIFTSSVAYSMAYGLRIHTGKEWQVEWDLGILADAGVEKTATTLMISVVACVAQRKWVSKAQVELDAVIGSDRLPDFEDMKNLPYIQAAIQEVFRWRHPVPACVPHATTQDDHYQGYLIPKGSVVVPLFSATRQDETVFQNPTDFCPERWIGRTQPGSFGYGRRACSGRHIARNNLIIAIARMLWAFHVRTPSGKATSVEEGMFTTGFVSAPKSFRAMFKPRSAQPIQVIRETHDNTKKDITIILKGMRENLRAISVVL